MRSLCAMLLATFFVAFLVGGLAVGVLSWLSAAGRAYGASGIPQSISSVEMRYDY